MATKQTVTRLQKSQGKSPAPRAKAHAHGELTPAEREKVEGKVAHDYLAGLMVALEKAAPKPRPLLTPAAVGERGAMLAAELRALSGSLGEALGDIIEAHLDDDVSAFSEALRRVNSARVVLRGEASKLEAVQL